MFSLAHEFTAYMQARDDVQHPSLHEPSPARRCAGPHLRPQRLAIDPVPAFVLSWPNQPPRAVERAQNGQRLGSVPHGRPDSAITINTPQPISVNLSPENCWSDHATTAIIPE